MTAIDWSKFDEDPEMTITCGCGAVFRSHAKFVNVPEPHVETRKPCPACGKTDRVRAARGDPESFTLRKDDVGKP